jgi:hypothetical protein
MVVAVASPPQPKLRRVPAGALLRFCVSEWGASAFLHEQPVQAEHVKEKNDLSLQTVPQCIFPHVDGATKLPQDLPYYAGDPFRALYPQKLVNRMR